MERATAAGIEMAVIGDRVKLHAPRRPPDELVEELRRHKAELLDLLVSGPLRHVYRFRLSGGEGAGLYITEAPTLDLARDALLQRYGVRLAMVVQNEI